ncbi:MAG: hypothetical protein KAI94_13905, partial [Anaerolineales bacterium]|nr:hypothetical protein [Anaerolineales bacterium]
FDLVVANQKCEDGLPEDMQWVVAEEDLDDDYAVYRADLVDCDRPWHHDSERLAQVLIDLLEERTGPLVE